MNKIQLSSLIRGLKFNGDQGLGHCPFHNDNNKSFSINRKTGLWICHAGCGSGNFNQFMEKREVDVKRNCEVITDNKGTTNKPDAKWLPIDLQQQGKGFCDNLIDNWNSISKPDMWTKDAVELCFAGYDQGSGHLTFVETDKKGKALNISWHKTKSVKGHGKTRWYPAHLLERYLVDKSLYIVEGHKDAVTAISLGYQAISSTNGANNFPSLDDLFQFNEIVIGYDNDLAGWNGSIDLALRLKEKFPAKKIRIAGWENKIEHFDVSDAIKEEVDKYFILARTISTDNSNINSNFPNSLGQFKLTTLPSYIKETVLDIAETTDAPYEFLLISLLSFQAGLIGSVVEGPNKIQPNLNAVLFAGSSRFRKSSAINNVLRLFSKCEMSFQEEYNNAMIRWRAENHLRNKKVQAKLPNRNTFLIPPDFSESAFYNTQKVNKCAGIIVAREYSDYHQKLHREHTGMADAMLNAYDGAPMSRITRSFGEEIVENPCFSILGATTINSFSRVFTATETENGTLQRIFPVVAVESSRKRISTLDRKAISKKIQSHFDSTCTKWSTHIQKKQKVWGRDPKIVIKIDEKNVQKFKEWEKSFIAICEKLDVDILMGIAERMIVGCLKVATILESFNISDPTNQRQRTLTISSLESAQAIVEHIFLPSMIYLIKNEFRQIGKGSTANKIVKTLKSYPNQITDKTTLMNKVKLQKLEFDNAIKQLEKTQTIIVFSIIGPRIQGGGRSKYYYKLFENQR